jgi:ribosome-associated heat shock protein Hsp15
VNDAAQPARVRLDRWLWAARFFKTRAQAKAAIEGGKVQFHLPAATLENADRLARPKVSKEITIGDTITVRRSDMPQTVVVTALSEKRASAAIAASLYAETPESIEAREAQRAQRRMERLGLRVPPRRPEKNELRALRKLKRDD